MKVFGLAQRVDEAHEGLALPNASTKQMKAFGYAELVSEAIEGVGLLQTRGPSKQGCLA